MQSKSIIKDFFIICPENYSHTENINYFQTSNGEKGKRVAIKIWIALIPVHQKHIGLRRKINYLLKLFNNYHYVL